jgi:hypothetical protein
MTHNYNSKNQNCYFLKIILSYINLFKNQFVFLYEFSSVDRNIVVYIYKDRILNSGHLTFHLKIEFFTIKLIDKKK